MRIRTAKFVMIPMWLLDHTAIRGNATRIAVYAGLRAVAWEAPPDQEWRSLREIARAIGDVIGMAEETIRKHLAVLESIGAYRRGDEELVIHDDEPGLGFAVGPQRPNVGSPATQTDDSHLLLSEREKENTSVGVGLGSAEVPLPTKGKIREEHPHFAEFWDAYPRHKDKPASIRAFNRALLDGATREQILEGLAVEMAGWQAAKRPSKMIPYPATWLNSQGWTNDPDRSDGTRSSTRSSRAAAATEQQRSEMQQAIDAGRHAEAWAMLIQKSETIPETRWWREADLLLAAGRSNQVVAGVTGCSTGEIKQFRVVRDSALSGEWMSPGVKQLLS